MGTRWIVAGPPCSGKSTFVRTNAGFGDRVFDYDEVMATISGRPLHEHDEGLRDRVLAARAALVEELGRDPDLTGWVITATYRAQDLRELRDAVGGQVVLLMVDQVEAHRRCDQAGRPAAWHEYIDRWFERTDIDPAEFPMPDMKGHRSMNKKTYTAGLKLAGQEGDFEAIFARLGVIDLDRDVTFASAFTLGQPVIIESWNHGSDLPVGEGAIYVDEDEGGDVAKVRGRFFLSSQAGRDHYTVVKEMGPLTQWSYTFWIRKSRPGTFQGVPVRFLEDLDVSGVSPVTRAAGLGTGTTFLKAGRRGHGRDPLDGHLADVELRMQIAATETRIKRMPATRLDAQLADIETRIKVAELETRIKQAEAGPPRPTNLDVLRERVVATYGSDHSPAWLQVMVESELQRMADEQAQHYRSYPAPTARVLALEWVQGWARAPAARG